MSRSRTIATAVFGVAALILAACHHPPPEPPPEAPPPAPPPVAGPTIQEQNLATLAADETFASGSWTLTRRGRERLGALLPQLKGLPPGAKVVVYGYTDNAPIGVALKKRGVEDNLDLSSKRADAVVRYLQERGVDPGILSAKGRGDTHPIAPNDTPQGRRQNRRIELVVETPTG
jgi:chemotaxis protein MotB